MLYTGSLTLLLGLLVPRVLAADTDVIELTEENFGERMAASDWMVEIYAPWSGILRLLQPD